MIVIAKSQVRCQRKHSNRQKGPLQINDRSDLHECIAYKYFTMDMAVTIAQAHSTLRSHTGGSVITVGAAPPSIRKGSGGPIRR